MFQHSYLLISKWKPIIYHGEGWFENGIFFTKLSVSTLGSNGGRFVVIPMYQSVSALLHLGKCTTFLSLRVGWFQPSLDISRELYIPCPFIPLVLSMFLAKHATGQFRLLNSSGTLLDWGLVASQSSEPVGRHSSLVSCHKKFVKDFFCRPGAQGSLANSKTSATQQGFFSSVFPVVIGGDLKICTKVYQQCWKEWEDWRAQEGVPKNFIATPNELIFWFICLWLDWLDEQLVLAILLFQPFWILIITRLQIIPASLKYFIYSVLLDINILICQMLNVYYPC